MQIWIGWWQGKFPLLQWDFTCAHIAMLRCKALVECCKTIELRISIQTIDRFERKCFSWSGTRENFLLLKDTFNLVEVSFPIVGIFCSADLARFPAARFWHDFLQVWLVTVLEIVVESRTTSGLEFILKKWSTIRTNILFLKYIVIKLRNRGYGEESAQTRLSGI